MPFASSHGTNISSVFTGAPFLPKSFAILASSLSRFDASITGTPSTTKILSNPSSYSTLYLYQQKVGSISHSSLQSRSTSDASTDFASISE